MSSNQNKPLSNHIKDVLHDHQEPYVLGSWERFQKYQHKKRKTHWAINSLRIAASVLIILSCVYAWNTLDIYQEELVSEGQSAEQQETIENDFSLTPVKPRTLFGSNTSVAETESADDDSGSDSESTQTTSQQVYLTENNLIRQKQITDKVSFGDALISPPVYRYAGGGIPESVRMKAATQNENPEKMYSQNRVPEQAEFFHGPEKQKNNFTFSVGYASVIHVHDSRTDFGMGGGFYSDWNISEHVAVSSGMFMAQNQLTYNNEHVNLRSKMQKETTLTSADHLRNIQVDLVSLEIPLNIKYFVTKNISVSAGISSVTFLKEDYNYNFEYEQQIQVFDDQNGSGSELVTRVVTFSETQQESEPSMNGMDWAAFYTLSAGLQHNFARHYMISIEPFVKIPTGQVASRNIRYTTGGVQLKVSF